MIKVITKHNYTHKHTIIPLFDLTLSHTFCINSSLLCMFAFFLADPVIEYLATFPPTLKKSYQILISLK